MNLSIFQPLSTSTLTWHVLVETLEQGQIAVWVAEFLECKVVADSQEAAIAALEELLKHRMTTIKVLPLRLSSEDSWFKVGWDLAK
jgi:hypothetical protein